VSIFLFIYVDDIIVAGSSPDVVDALLQDLRGGGGDFALKDFRELHYFLGIEAHKLRDGLLLT
jgi:hypothetical protein